jgi:hypothetical protein
MKQDRVSQDQLAAYLTGRLTAGPG